MQRLLVLLLVLVGMVTLWGETAVSQQDGSAWFVHIATSSNTTDSTTFIDHPRTNNNSNAILIITPNWNPGGVGGTYFNESFEVDYIAARWVIVDSTGDSIPNNTAFNIYVGGKDDDIYVHIHDDATQSTFKRSYLNHPLLNNNPDALIFITHNRYETDVTNGFQAPVEYDDTLQQWFLHHYLDGEEFMDVPDQAAYNVLIRSQADDGSFLHIAAEETITNNYTHLDHPDLNNNPDALIQISHEWEGICCSNEFSRLGVWYDSGAGQWAIFAQDLQEPFAEDSRYHVTISQMSVNSDFILFLPYIENE